MPAKKGGVVTPQQVRELVRDERSMRYAILALQVESGDRVDDPRFLRRNQTHERRGWRQIDPNEWQRIRATVIELIEAAATRRGTALAAKESW
jgi:hypothetical protein